MDLIATNPSVTPQPSPRAEQWIDTLLHSPPATGLLMAASVWVSALLSHYSHQLSTIWIANAVVFVWLLPLPLRRMPWHIACAVAASVGVALFFHSPFLSSLIGSIGNMAEVVLLLLLTHRFYDPVSRRFRITALRFTLLTIAVVAGVCFVLTPFVAGRIGPHLLLTMANWVCGDVLGILLVTALAGFWRRHAYNCAFHRSQIDGTLLCIAVVLAGSWLAFAQNTYPLRFVAVSVLIYVVFKRGLAVAFLCLTLHAILACAFTIAGVGLMVPMQSASQTVQVLCLQIYLFVMMATIYPVGVALFSQQKLQSLYSLLANNSGDVVVRADLNGVRQYCSPSVVRVLGWTPEEMVSVESASSYHPDDIPRVKALIQKMRDGQIVRTVEQYRIRTKSGQYLWMEGHINVLLDSVTNVPTGFIGTLRDISERIAAEAKLQAAHRDLERLASTDPLTGLANRRNFDESLEREWRRAKRERTPLALIMMDVDFFKKYNDSLGHPAGDECLRRVSQCLSQIVQRPSDLVARYGGEEFVALLPFTEAAGAQQLAQRIKDALGRLALPHPASPVRIVALSIGVASIFPSLGDTPASLVTAADCALYAAKDNGRNRIELSQPQRIASPGQAAWEHSEKQAAEILADPGDIDDIRAAVALTRSALSRIDPDFTVADDRDTEIDSGLARSQRWR